MENIQIIRQNFPKIKKKIRQNFPKINIINILYIIFKYLNFFFLNFIILIFKKMKKSKKFLF